MSSNKCNYCLLQAIRRHAETIGWAVTVRAVTKETGIAMLPRIELGYDVFIHPADIREDELRVHTLDEEPGEYFAAWLAAITDHCICGED